MKMNWRNITSDWYCSTVGFVNATGSLGVLAAWGVYDFFITKPLRVFYLKGPWWQNIPHSEICSHLTGSKAAWYEACEDRMTECHRLIEQNFESWDATVMTVLYFCTLTFILGSCFCHCLYVRPILRAIKEKTR